MKLIHHKMSTQVFDWGGDLRATLQKQKPIWLRLRLNRKDGQLTSVDLRILDHYWVLLW